jgi:poly(3-hydroxybutyrate) depolymerase
MTEKALRTFGGLALSGFLALALPACGSDTADVDDPVQASSTGPDTSAAPTASDTGPPMTPSATTPMGGPSAPATVNTPSTPGMPTTPMMPTVSATSTDTASPPLPTAPTGGGGGLGGADPGGGSGGGAAAGAPGGGGTGGSAETGGSAGAAGASGGDSGGSAGSGSEVAQSAGCGSPRTLMNGRKTIQSGGNREYILRVPDDYDENHPYRLVMAYHWLSGNADQVANGGGGGSTEDPYYGLWDLAEGSTIFVAPEGLDAGWANSGDRDIALTDAILDELQNDLCIDTTRIFSTGFSYGAGMSYALACARADVFRGVVLYAGAQLSGCNGGNRPIAYFHAHGVGDSVLNISQGRQLRDRFVDVNGCTPQNPPEPAQNSGSHICTSYEGCSEGHPLRWCAHGGDHNPTEKDQGQSESWVPAEAWDFISQF